MPFELQPTLRGALVELRALRADDYDALYAVASDPLICEQHPENTRYQPDVFRRFFQGAMESGAALLATDAQTGQVILRMRIVPVPPNRQTRREFSRAETYQPRCSSASSTRSAPRPRGTITNTTSP